MFVCPEQIPAGYSLSVFGDRWTDVRAITAAVDKLFKKHVKKWKEPEN